MSQTDKRKRGRGSVISDPRFARLHTDARFQVFPNKQRKVEIDERFKGKQVLGLRQSSSLHDCLRLRYTSCHLAQMSSLSCDLMQECSRMNDFNTEHQWTKEAERRAQPLSCPTVDRRNIQGCYQYIDWLCRPSGLLWNVQVKKVKKNEDLTRYYRLQDEV